MTTLWPQIFVVAWMIAMAIYALMQHGKPVESKPIYAPHTIWVVLTMAVVLGAGGFWRPLGW